MTDYYVDATGGDDGGTGAIGDAWKTISKVNAASFSAGDSIHFKRGEVWRELLDIPSSGSAGNPITFGAYGAGAKPRITGGAVVSSFSAGSGLVAVASQTAHDFNFFNFGRDTSNYWRASEWTASESFDCEEVRCWMAQVGTIGAGDVWIEIWDDDTGTPGSIIANGTSDTVAGSSVSTSGELITFNFSTPPSLTSGNTYYFVAKFSWTLSTSNYMQWRGHNAQTADGFNGWRILQSGTEEDLNVDQGDIRIFKAAENQWEATVTPDPRVVYFVADDMVGLEQSDAASVSAANQWHWASNTLTVYAASDPSGDVEVGARNSAITTNGQSYLDFEDLQLDIALQYVAYIEGATASNINWTRIDFAMGFEFNLVTSVSAQTDDCAITDCTSKWSGASGYQLNGVKDNWVFLRCTSDYDSIVAPGFDRGSGENDFGAAFKIVSDRTLDALTNIVFDSCTATRGGYHPTNDVAVSSGVKGFGFWIDQVQASSGDENIIRDCIADTCSPAGFFCEKSDYSILHHIIAKRCGGIGLLVGGRLDADPPQTANNKFYHVTLCSNGIDNPFGFAGGNLLVAGGYASTADQVFNNHFANLLLLNSGETSEAVFEFGGENDGTLGYNNRYEYLSLGVEAASFVEWANATLLNTYAAWDAAYQASSGGDIDALHYVNAAPMLTDPCDDVTPASGSPLIGAGLVISGISTLNPTTLGAIEVAEASAAKARIRSPRFGLTRLARR